MSSPSNITFTKLISNPDESYQANIIACAAITWIIGATFVGLRFYTRKVLLQNVLGAEDWFILLALVFAAATCAGMIEQAIYGLGKHTLDIDPSLLIHMARAGWYTILHYLLTLLLTKLSILLLYLRLLSYQNSRYLVHFILSVVLLTNGLWTLSTVVTACLPLAAFWDKASYPNAYCHPRSFWLGNTGLHIGTDILLYVLPLPVIVNLQMRRRQKVALYGIFALGFFVCSISVVRLWDLVEQYHRFDFTFDNVSIAYLTCVEINAAIACACCMTLKPFVSKVLPRFFPTPSPRPSNENWETSGDSEAAGSEKRARRCERSQNPPTIGSKPSRRISDQDKETWISMYQGQRNSHSLELRESDLEAERGIRQSLLLWASNSTP
ncbi:hypothetical protein QBC36DRAFT_387776 [Triangularia setosa]|uniref:Rhodopsin domain-containing protein n=1 Tax=Triangularia setosa TaxID=2587417 RepID=A0AAN6W9J5_9PEZI|nr:hypothetical protein QBC36DRAFT_387776 [Podospora setosa]